jgi:hypothetical protein
MAIIGNQVISQAFVTDQFSGNGSTTAFTMSVAPANTASVLVAVSGVLQDPSTYSVSGTTLTFSAAPPSATGNISARYLGIPASGVTTTAYRTVTEFTATAAQTTFSTASYTAGYLDVYRNGVKLGSADYTATNGTTVVLAAGATAGDLVTTVSFYVSSVVNAIPAITGSISSTYIAAGAVGTTQIAAGAVGTTQLAAGAVGTTQLASSAVTPTILSQPFTSGTSQASTSGTSINFTGIPSWVKRITIMFKSVSTNGSSNWLVRLGTSSGIVSTGYLGSGAYVGSVTGGANSTAGFILQIGSTAQVMHGTVVLCLQDSSSNSWVQNATLGDSSQAFIFLSAGSLTLASVLTQVRITTVNGTDAFDAGAINILYE